MADYSIFIGTAGFGLHISRDGGGSWAGAASSEPPPSAVGGLEGTVRALAVYPDNPHRLLAGTDIWGLYRTEDNGQMWEPVPSAAEGFETARAPVEIWSLAIDPEDTDTIYVGTRPDGFRTRDGGATWDTLTFADRGAPLWPPRTTVMVVDPRDHRTVWAGAEVDGVHRSLDGGDTWERRAALGPELFYNDVHCMGIRNGARTIVHATSPMGFATSSDDGASWSVHKFAPLDDQSGHSYCRCMIINPNDPDMMFVGTGNSIPGSTGAVRRTRDGGESWETLSLPEEPNSVVYWLAMHRDVPGVVVGFSLLGCVYVSEDDGDSWRKLDKEFGQIRSVAVTPN